MGHYLFTHQNQIIMFKRPFLPLLALVLFLAACSNQGKKSGEAEGMTQFADDEAFKEAHALPGELQFEGKGEMIRFATPDGQEGGAYALMPAAASDKYLFVIHEWWGLNDHIKAEAERLFAELGDVNVLALDMYDGKSTADRDEAGKLMQAVKEERARAIVQGAIAKAGPEARIGTIGWCFGGGWSLNASIMAGPLGAACVMYYGMPVQQAQELAALQAPILGIFASEDGWITPEVAQKFENLAKASGKRIETLMFEAEHAFANPSNPQFDQEATQQAHEAAVAFLKEHL
jgi:carboxymethylenebutenolidase